MNKRLVLSFDGTWNTPEHEDRGDLAPTNVLKMHISIPKVSTAGVTQSTRYFKGVGTNWYDRVRGGAFGLGLDKIIREGYKFLIRNYEEGDDLYLFGFSRGAYIARSLVGLIRNSGLLKNVASSWRLNRLIDEAYELYRTRDEGPDTPAAKSFRARYAREITIKFLGVWDTVGALGIPIDSFDRFNRRFFEFHDTRLSGIVENAFHALAIDEYRPPFKPTLWAASEPTAGQTMEQRWFIGAHANVGGGYRDSYLSDLALHWMQQKARACDLELNPISVAEHHLGVIRDSYEEWPSTARKIFPNRYYRPIGQSQNEKAILDESVLWQRQADSTYRQPNLEAYLQRHPDLLQ